MRPAQMNDKEHRALYSRLESEIIETFVRSYTSTSKLKISLDGL